MVNSGVYALRHKATGKVYVGSSTNFRRRRATWWHRMNSDHAALTPAMRALTASRHDWEFIVLWDGADATPGAMQEAEQRAVARVQAAAPDRLLNSRRPVRPNTAGVTLDGKTLTQRAWSEVTGVQQPTIAKRLAAGWPADQALGFAPRPPRNRGEEALVRSLVVVYDGERPLSVSETALRLGCAVKTLKERLRGRRVPGRQASVQLDVLIAGSAKYRS